MCTYELTFRPATACEADEVLALYQSVKGHGTCVWDDDYPTMREIAHDLETGNLYVLSDGCQIIGTISIVPENELDDQDCFVCRDGSQREIARIAVRREWRGYGLAGQMVERIADRLRNEGCHAIHLSAASANVPALKTYRKIGFCKAGEAYLYGGLYSLLELDLTAWNVEGAST